MAYAHGVVARWSAAGRLAPGWHDRQLIIIAEIHCALLCARRSRKSHCCQWQCWCPAPAAVSGPWEDATRVPRSPVVAGRTAQCQNRRPRSRRRRSGTVPRRRAAKTRAGRWRAERSGVEGRVGQRGDEELRDELRAPLPIGARERALVGRWPSVPRAVGSREMRKTAATRTAKDADDSISDNNSATRTTAAPAVEELSDAGEGGKGSES